MLLADKEQQIPINTEEQSHLVFYKHTPRSCTLTCVLLEASAGSSGLALYAVVSGYESRFQLQNFVLFVDVYVGGHTGEQSHSQALM